MITIDKQNKEHDIKAKLKIGVELSKREECYYLLFMADEKEIRAYKKGERKCDCKNKL